MQGSLARRTQPGRRGAAWGPRGVALRPLVMGMGKSLRTFAPMHSPTQVRTKLQQAKKLLKELVGQATGGANSSSSQVPSRPGSAGGSAPAGSAAAPTAAARRAPPVAAVPPLELPTPPAAAPGRGRGRGPGGYNPLAAVGMRPAYNPLSAAQPPPILPQQFIPGYRPPTMASLAGAPGPGMPPGMPVPGGRGQPVAPGRGYHPPGMAYMPGMRPQQARLPGFAAPPPPHWQGQPQQPGVAQRPPAPMTRPPSSAPAARWEAPAAPMAFDRVSRRAAWLGIVMRGRSALHASPRRASSNAFRPAMQPGSGMSTSTSASSLPTAEGHDEDECVVCMAAPKSTRESGHPPEPGGSGHGSRACHSLTPPSSCVSRLQSACPVATATCAATAPGSASRAGTCAVRSRALAGLTLGNVASPNQVGVPLANNSLSTCLLPPCACSHTDCVLCRQPLEGFFLINEQRVLPVPRPSAPS